jgi:hypothetical protein
MDAATIAEARALWDSHKPYEAGRLIYEALPNDRRPFWAADILDLCLGALPSTDELEDAIDEMEDLCALARRALTWRDAHDAFSRVRDHTLAEDRTHAGGPVYVALLEVAENVAKVTYNASGQPAPFDYNCGYRLVCCLRHFFDQIGSPKLEAEAWTLMERWLHDPEGPPS